jgi:hypothetical protein
MRGSRGEHVAALQRLLNETGVTPELTPDGVFGPKTEAAVRQFQHHMGFHPSGEADHGTIAALRSWDSLPGEVTDNSLHGLAYRLRVDYPAIVAIVAVESRGQGFLPSGRPTILYERHIMRRRLARKGAVTQHLPEDIVSATPGGYLGGEREWGRLLRAQAIDWVSAVESASWGLFQVMGFHWQRLGYASAQEWFDLMHRGETHHQEAFARFLEADPVLLQALRDHRWQAVAHRYNGPNYAINRYDERLAAEYAAASRGMA